MKTITFYSYKGGVGRSLILANVAKRLTEIGKNVCMLDFDLEAPGLEFKFWDYKSEDKTKGVVDFITSFTEDGTLPLDILEYTSEIKIANRKHHGWLKLIKAGDIEVEGGIYWKKLMSIDWKKLFYTSEGKGYELILHLKALIEKQIEPDYLLVDSRTGITEISGITLSLLADEVVVVAANNNENIVGSGLIIKSLNANSNGVVPKVNFVLSRVPYTNKPEDRAKEFDKIKEVKQDYADEGIEIDDVHVIHSDRELEEDETLKIGESEIEGEIRVDNDYLYFFDKVIKPDLTDKDLQEFNNIVQAKMLLEQATLVKDTSRKLILLNGSIKLDPENDFAYLNRAVVFESMRKLEEAEKDYLSQFDYSKPKNDFSYHRLIRFYYDHQMYSKVIEFTNQVPLSSLEYTFELRRDQSEIIIGMAQMMLGNYLEAFSIIDKKLKDSPENVPLLFFKSDIYLRQGDIKQAEKYLEEVIKRNGDYTEALYNMAIVQSVNGKIEDLYIYLDRALGSDETNNTKNRIATEPEFKKYYNEEAFQRILYKYNIRLKTD